MALRDNFPTIEQMLGWNEDIPCPVYFQPEELTPKFTPINKRIIREIAANPARFTIIGENHSDILVEALVAELIETGRYSTLFLEALERGSYAEQGDSLKSAGGVYGWDPLKYDSIIRHAVRNGIEVHGIDHPERKGGGTSRDIARWADYILAAGRGKCLVLTGSMHAYDSPSWHEREINLPFHLSARGADKKDMLTIISGNSRSMDIGQVYNIMDLPDAEGCNGIGDYLFVDGRACESAELEEGYTMKIISRGESK